MLSFTFIKSCQLNICNVVTLECVNVCYIQQVSTSGVATNFTQRVLCSDKLAILLECYEYSNVYILITCSCPA